MSRTPLRTVRVPDEVWAHAQAQAEIEGTSVSEYIVRALKRWKAKR